MSKSLKFFKIFLLIIGVLIIVGNLVLVLIDSDIDCFKKRISLGLGLLLILSVIGQFLITQYSENSTKKDIDDLDIDIYFTIDPTKLQTIIKNRELADYLPKRNVIDIDEQFLRRLEENKSEILAEIFKDWSLLFSKSQGQGYKANYTDKINQFEFLSFLAGPYSFHLECKVNYNINIRSLFHLKNLKDLNSDILSLTIISNQNRVKQILSRVDIKINTAKTQKSVETEYRFVTNFNKVIPQRRNALNDLTTNEIAKLIMDNSENIERPLTLYTKRRDGMWVWNAEKKFINREY